ncbi:DUF7550 family protein [Haladaptatus sp. NG-SE-30]
MSGHEYEPEEIERVTAPQQEFTMSQVTTGLVVFVVGLAVTFGIPLVLF